MEMAAAAPGIGAGRQLLLTIGKSPEVCYNLLCMCISAHAEYTYGGDYDFTWTYSFHHWWI